MYNVPDIEFLKNYQKFLDGLVGTQLTDASIDMAINQANSIFENHCIYPDITQHYLTHLSWNLNMQQRQRKMGL